MHMHKRIRIKRKQLNLTFNVTLSFHLRTIESARKSFHVTKLWNVSPVIRSHVMNVLRCVDMPELYENWERFGLVKCDTI